MVRDRSLVEPDRGRSKRGEIPMMRKYSIAAMVSSIALMLGSAAYAAEPQEPSSTGSAIQSVPVAFIVERVHANAQSAGRERGELAKVLGTLTGISVRDIEKYGLFGGPNSIFRKPFG
jgi:hypothetical protein